ncbi:hypothetical protein AWV80_39670 [Cupriavidus sp. UYMU48A]|nr:hypothetical protein AWV80_39670 [Cupriavidus sp. UYMU48A]
MTTSARDPCQQGGQAKPCGTNQEGIETAGLRLRRYRTQAHPGQQAKGSSLAGPEHEQGPPQAMEPADSEAGEAFP